MQKVWAKMCKEGVCRSRLNKIIVFCRNLEADMNLHVKGSEKFAWIDIRISDTRISTADRYHRTMLSLVNHWSNGINMPIKCLRNVVSGKKSQTTYFLYQARYFSDSQSSEK